MDGKTVYGNTDDYILTTETVSKVSVSSHDEILFQSKPSLDIKDFNTSNDASFSLKGENSVLTSTPNFPWSKKGYRHHGSVNREENDNLRKRKEESHHVQYTYDLFEGKKSNKKRLTLLQSLSVDQTNDEELHLDTLENHLFPDMSFSESELSYNESKFNFPQLSDWSKLHGVSYSSKVEFYGDGLDTNRSINHPKRSIFRQNRRDWYLNRRSLQMKSGNISLLWRSVRTFLHILLLISVQMHQVVRKIRRNLYITYYSMSKFLQYITSPILSIFRLHQYIYNLIKTKVISIYSKVRSLFVFSSINEDIFADGIITKKDRFSWCFLICFWVLLLLAIILAIFAGGYVEQNLPKKIVPIPNPMKSGIENAYPIYIDTENTIPAWHIYPNLPSSSVIHPIKKSLKSLSVVMYLRNAGDVDTPKLKSVYQTLSSLGYHIVVPTNVLSQHEVLTTWRWIKSQTNSTVYMWGYGMSAAALTVNAKLFCKYLIPPNGVVIAREIKMGHSHQSMEIWSCNCALPITEYSNATDFKYNHIKCPIVFDEGDTNDVYSQVVACIETVNKNVE